MKYLHYTLIPLCCILINIGLYSQEWEEVTIYTPNNTKITAYELVSGDYTTDEKNAIRDAVEEYWVEDVFYEDEATRAYNCHGYTWQVVEGEDEVYIHDPDDDKFWDDGSYVEVLSETAADKISYGYCNTTDSLPVCIDWYYEGEVLVCSVYVCKISGNLCDHSAVPSATQGYFISKWGPMCLVKHKWDQIPYLIESGGPFYFKRCRDGLYGYNITGTFWKTDCCEFVLENGVIAGNANVTLKTKNYDDHKQIEEYILIEGTFSIAIGATLEINCD